MTIYTSPSLYIRRPLPELERARLQLQPSNTILQAAAPTILQECIYYAAGCRLHPTVLQTAGDSLLCTILKGQH